MSNTMQTTTRLAKPCDCSTCPVPTPSLSHLIFFKRINFWRRVTKNRTSLLTVNGILWTAGSLEVDYLGVLGNTWQKSFSIGQTGDDVKNQYRPKGPSQILCYRTQKIFRDAGRDWESMNKFCVRIRHLTPSYISRIELSVSTAKAPILNYRGRCFCV